PGQHLQGGRLRPGREHPLPLRASGAGRAPPRGVSGAQAGRARGVRESYAADRAVVDAQRDPEAARARRRASVSALGAPELDLRGGADADRAPLLGRGRVCGSPARRGLHGSRAAPDVPERRQPPGLGAGRAAPAGSRSGTSPAGSGMWGSGWPRWATRWWPLTRSAISSRLRAKSITQTGRAEPELPPPGRRVRRVAGGGDLRRAREHAHALLAPGPGGAPGGVPPGAQAGRARDLSHVQPPGAGDPDVSGGASIAGARRRRPRPPLARADGGLREVPRLRAPLHERDRAPRGPRPGGLRRTRGAPDLPGG